MSEKTLTTAAEDAELNKAVAQTVKRVESIEANSLVFALVSNAISQSAPLLDDNPSLSYRDRFKIPEILLGTIFEKEWFLSIRMGSRLIGNHFLPMPYISLREGNVTHHLKVNLQDLLIERDKPYSLTSPWCLVGFFLEKKKFLYLLSWGLDALESSLRETIEEYLPNDIKLSDIEAALVNLSKKEFLNPEQEAKNKFAALRKAMLKAVGDLDESRKISSSPVFGEIKKNLLQALEDTV